MSSFQLYEILVSTFALYFFLDFAQMKYALELSRLFTLSFSVIVALCSLNPFFQIACVLLLLISEIDRRDYRIPDVFTKSAIAILVLVYRDERDLLLLTLFWFLVMYTLTYFAPALIGRGDIKLIAALLLGNGYFQLFPNSAFLLGLIALASALALPKALTNRFGAGTRGAPGNLPFAPSIAGSWTLLAFFGAG